MQINTVAGGEYRPAGCEPVFRAQYQSHGWITSRNELFKMKSDLLRESYQPLRRTCLSIAGIFTRRHRSPG
mgnify:CR=1|jgi:hypothetical protein|tara:strand:+ start:1412 stop:1624 length:213 start_codon:yes stop_codon:yes gene_type:complete